MSNFDRLRNRPTRTTSETLALNPDDADRLTEARRAKTRAEATLDVVRRTAGDDHQRLADAEADLQASEEALAAVEASIVTFTVHLHGIGPRRVEELMVEHKATQQQQRKAKQLNNGDPRAQPVWNEDTFPPALLAEAVTKITFSDDPDNPVTSLSLEQATELWMDRWSVGDKLVVFNAAQMLDQAPSHVEALGKG